MKVNGIGSYEASKYANLEDKKSDLSIDDFLKIMAAEISNPSVMGGEGGSKTDYLTQLTQFSILEQLQNITTSIENLALAGQKQESFNLFGKDVVINSEEGLVEGQVEKVRFTEGRTILEINGKYYDLKDLVEVKGR